MIYYLPSIWHAFWVSWQLRRLGFARKGGLLREPYLIILPNKKSFHFCTMVLPYEYKSLRISRKSLLADLVAENLVSTDANGV